MFFAVIIIIACILLIIAAILMICQVRDMQELVDVLAMINREDDVDDESDEEWEDE